MAISNVVYMRMTVVFVMKNFTSWFHVEVKAVSLINIFRNTSKGTTAASRIITSTATATSTNGSTITTNIITGKCIELVL